MMGLGCCHLYIYCLFRYFCGLVLNIGVTVSIQISLTERVPWVPFKPKQMFICLLLETLFIVLV